VDPATRGDQLRREERRALVASTCALQLAITGSRGYNFAEVTAGGVPLSELHLETMESRKCPGLYLVGEICDVDGRIGGFNFQWAWSSGFVAGTALGGRT
jgi:predicted flavoprotein YhiN